jgi:predicted DNA-binding transcriptional regulator YafY
MNRIDRVSAILIHLQSKKFVTADEVARRFEISKRTVYRDIRALEEAGIPIGTEAGKGYFIVAGYHLPPVMFTKEEASAMLTAEKMVEKLTDHSITKYFQSAMFKIKAVLPDKEKQFIDDLHANIEVFYSLKTDFPNNYISDIHQALANHLTLTISYQSIYKDELTQNRTIEPVGLCFYGLGWHLIAYCQMRNEYRDFRADRINQLKVNSDTYKSREFHSVRDYFSQLRQSTELFEVILKFDKKVTPIVNTVKYYYGFIDEEEINGQLEMTFITSDLQYFARWLIMYADAVEIVSPEALQSIFKELITSIIQRTAL